MLSVGWAWLLRDDVVSLVDDVLIGLGVHGDDEAVLELSETQWNSVELSGTQWNT